MTELVLSADVVRDRISQLKHNIMAEYLELGRLLREVQRNGYHRDYGYANFGTWVEQASGLDMSKRQAAYLVAVVERAEELQIPDEQLHRVRLSKAKEILSLPGDTATADDIRALLTEAETAPLSEIRQSVARLKHAEYEYRNLRFESEAITTVWNPAVEKVRRTHGGYRGEDGQGVDISESQAALYMAAELLAQPDEFDVDENVVEGQFEDLLISEEI